MRTKPPSDVRLRSTSMSYTSGSPVAVPSLIVDSSEDSSKQSSADSTSGLPTKVKLPSPLGSKELFVIKDEEISNMAKKRFITRLNTARKNVREDREGTRIIVAMPDKTRKYVPLRPGRSLMDWIRLSNAATDLSGTDGRFLDVTEDELKKHSKINDAWMCLKGKVYNLTPYLEFHPGGADILMSGIGKDATELFYQTHKWVNFEAMLQKCLVGRLVSLRAPLAKLIHHEKETEKKRRQPSESHNASLVAKKQLNHNTYLFSFEMDKPSRMFIPVAKHVVLTLGDENGDKVSRSYSPFPKNLLENDLNLDNHVHAAIKIYGNGQFTQLLDKLEIGDPIEISDFYGEFDAERLNNIRYFIGIAGGTGITPIAGIVHHVYVKARLKLEQVKVLHLVSEEKDFLFKEELDALSQRKSNFVVSYVVGHPSAEWQGYAGLINEDFLACFMPTTEPNQKLICICGPTDFNYRCASHLQELGVPHSEIFVFPNKQIATKELPSSSSLSP